VRGGVGAAPRGRGITARDARTGRVRWRADGSVLAVAAGRVYTQEATLDLATGERVGAHAPVYGGIALLAEAPGVRR
jgi:hypothetical protein